LVLGSWFLVLGWVSQTSKLNAQVDDHPKIECKYTVKQHKNYSKSRTYYINTKEFSKWSNLDENVVEAVIVSAAETWNSMGNVGTLVYGGRTSILTLPQLESDCINDHAYINLVTMVETPTLQDHFQANAVMKTRCLDSNNFNISNKFLLEVHAKRDKDLTGTFSYIDWRTTVFTDGTCTLETDSKDLEGMAVHELGHAFNLDHPPNDEATSMNPSGGSYCWLSGNLNDAKWSDVRRDLWPYDMHCSKKYNNSTAQRGTDLNDIKVNNELYYFDNYNSNFSYQIKDSFKGTFASELSTQRFYSIHNCLKKESTNFCVNTDAAYAYIPPDSYTNILGEDIVFFGKDLDYNVSYPHGWNTAHKILWTKYNPGINSSEIQLCFQYFNGQCIQLKKITSSRKVSIGVHDVFYKYILAWSRHAPNASDNKSVFISMIDPIKSQDFLSPPMVVNYSGANIKSDVSVGVSCQKNKVFSGKDCMMAYVDPDDHLSQIKVVPFSINEQPGVVQYQLVTGESINTKRKTAEAINMWYADGFFWMIYRDLIQQRIVTVYSTDGSYWDPLPDEDTIYLHNVDAMSHWLSNENAFVGNGLE
jgi:hypothetical protein